MSHHDENCDDHRQAPEPEQRGGETNFLDLEISKVLFDEAEGITRKAFRALLEEAAKRHLSERIGVQIEALAKLAVDELLADVAANLEIEARIAARKQAREGLDARIDAILRGSGEGG
jgi:hypothetical protein